jgi:ribonuclease HI
LQGQPQISQIAQMTRVLRNLRDLRLPWRRWPTRKTPPRSGALNWATALARPLKATVWFDGACSGNPGPMGGGAVIEVEGGSPQVLSMAFGLGTNNQAEYRALILGLRHALAAGVEEVVVKGDSELVLKQLLGKYRVRKEELKPLHAEAAKLLRQFRSSKLEWVPRAANAVADEASKKAIGLA